MAESSDITVSAADGEDEEETVTWTVPMEYRGEECETVAQSKSLQINKYTIIHAISQFHDLLPTR